MGINFNSGFNAGNYYAGKSDAKARPGKTTKVTIDGTTVVGTFPKQNALENNQVEKVSLNDIIAQKGVNFKRV